MVLLIIYISKYYIDTCLDSRLTSSITRLAISGSNNIPQSVVLTTKSIDWSFKIYVNMQVLTLHI